jgi:hypothetical protein
MVLRGLTVQSRSETQGGGELARARHSGKKQGMRDGVPCEELLQKPNGPPLAGYAG